MNIKIKKKILVCMLWLCAIACFTGFPWIFFSWDVIHSYMGIHDIPSDLTIVLFREECLFFGFFCIYFLFLRNIEKYKGLISFCSFLVAFMGGFMYLLKLHGADVNIHVVTNNNKVYRIMICDVNNIDERAIQIRFNRLCEQFVNNSKYSSLPLEEYMIPDDEDISYEITVHKKRYEAVFYQKTDETFMAKQIEAAFPQYTKEQLANPSEELRAEIVNFVTQYISKKAVWFMINERLGKYCITMYYDNEYNNANGEDL